MRGRRRGERRRVTTNTGCAIAHVGDPSADRRRRRARGPSALRPRGALPRAADTTVFIVIDMPEDILSHR